MDAFAEIRQTFFGECDEQLLALEEGLLAIEAGDRDPETLNAVFRAVHSVKGGAGAFQLVDLVRFAHGFEGALDLLRVGRLVPAPPLLRALLRATDVLADLVRAARGVGEPDPPRAAAALADLAALCGDAAPEGEGPEPARPVGTPAFTPRAAGLDDLAGPAPAEAVPAPSNRFRIGFRPRPELYAKGNDTVILMREVALLGEAEVFCDLSGLPDLAAMDPEGAYLAWTVMLDTARDEEALRDIFDFVEWDSALSIEAAEPAPVPAPPCARLAAPPAAPAVSRRPAPEPHEPAAAALRADPEPAATTAATIRVDLERVDRLIDLVGELVIHQSMLAERMGEARPARGSPVAVALDELEALTRGLQDSVMAIRAQPVKSVFARMPRLAREVAAQVGKSVRLVVEGEGTEVDRTVIERIADPLTHMVRNAIDHGLETPAARRAAGKPEEGQVRLSALHRSGRIVIEVSDDGAGIDRARVRAIAVARGLIPADARLSDEETDGLIFLPGFSTAATVSDISGRGVGMDVVKSSVLSLGGRISIASAPGRGSTFTLSLPLTLAVLDGMVVSAAGHTLVVPLSSVVEIVLPRTSAVHGFGGDARVVGLGGGFVPLLDVAAVLGLRDAPADPRAGVALIVEVEGGRRAGLLVDAIKGQRQVVIKSLEADGGPVPGIAAATIMGDGRVALILDVDAVAASPPRGDLPLALAG